MIHSLLVVIIIKPLNYHASGLIVCCLHFSSFWVKIRRQAGLHNCPYAHTHTGAVAVSQDRDISEQ